MRLVRLAKTQGGWLVLAVLLGVAGGVFIVVQANLLSNIVGRIFLDHGSLEDVATGMAALLAVFLVRAGMVWGSEFTAKKAAIRLKIELRQQLFSRLLMIGPAGLRRERTGELINTLTSGVDTLDAYFSQYLPQAALAALLPLTFLILIFPLDPLSGLVLLLTAPLIPIFMVLIGSLGEQVTRRQWSALSWLSAFYLDLMQGLTTLKMLGRGQEQSGVISRVNERYFLGTFKVLRVTFLSALALEMIATLSTAVVAVEVGLRLLYGRLDFSQALFILLLAPEFYMPLRTLGARFHAGMAGVTAAGRIFTILKQAGAADETLDVNDGKAMTTDRGLVNENPEPGAGGSAGKQPVVFEQPSILIQDVSFSYGPGRQALDGVTLEIPAGKTVALVGSSGAGKSTLASLLLRFIEPQQGSIMLNDQPLGEISVAQWRERVAWVPQNPYLFYGTLLDNIRLGDPVASQEKVAQAARLAHIDAFIDELPDGYETWIGEKGVLLSGGQAQRIALARAFLKDAPLLILDEATANLDVDLESQLVDSLGRLLEGRTVLVIAHRMSTIMRADHVVVLDAGRVIEEGSPLELLGKPGAFASLVKAYYRDSTRVQPNPQTDPQPYLSRFGSEGSPVNPLSLCEIDGVKEMKDHEQSITEFTQELRTIDESPPVFNWLMSFLKPYTFQVILAVLLGFLTVMSGVGLMAVSAYIISAAALTPSIADLQVAIVAVRAFGISRGILRYLERLVSHGVTLRVLGALRLSFYEKLEPLAPARIMHFHSGDLLRRIVGDINHLDDFFVRGFSPGMVAFLTALAAGLILGWFQPVLAYTLWISMLLAGILLPWMVRRLSRQPALDAVNSQAALSACMVDGVQGMADLLSYGAGKRQLTSLQQQAVKLGETEVKLSAVQGFQSATVGLLSNLAMWAILCLSIPQVETGASAGVMLASLILVALTSFEAIVPLPQAAQKLESDMAAGRRLLEVVSIRPEVQEPDAAQPFPEQPSLSVKRLSFCYPEYPVRKDGSKAVAFRQDGGQTARAGWALRDVSFKLEPGAKLAVVGASGAGKSTLVNLLLRYWEVHQGEIVLGKHLLRDYNSQVFRAHIGVVSQNTYLFNASLRENLLLAKPEAGPQEIEVVLEKTQLSAWVAGLPSGLETQVGELGLQISAGERQRIAIARALLKDPALLILDEPTANLDAITESRLMDTIFQIMAGRSILLVTHRLAGLDAMDEILVLSNGQIVERGTQADLLMRDGYLRRMWEIQHSTLV